MDVASKPAYQNDLLTLEGKLGQESSSRSHVTCAYNERGTSRQAKRVAAELPAINTLADSEPGKELSVRPEISGQTIQVNRPGPLLHWRPKAEDNADHVSVPRDQSPIYRGETATIPTIFWRCVMLRQNMPDETDFCVIDSEGLRSRGTELSNQSHTNKKMDSQRHEFISVLVFRR